MAFVDSCALGHGIFNLKSLSLCPYVSGTTNIQKAFLFWAACIWWTLGPLASFTVREAPLPHRK
ncbi:hypothetical protein Lalb_Chr17g0347701 [Lupinus albus]|uniref:Uncharacterized protein n=1 Tax=Lupinus albus TaxID=3870 RepID=A0A6A4NRE5_LUPAL|nr:hypothetical protein Lalb_Chr17g0347701 [Lupinus albus]